MNIDLLYFITSVMIDKWLKTNDWSIIKYQLWLRILDNHQSSIINLTKSCPTLRQVKTHYNFGNWQGYDEKVRWNGGTWLKLAYICIMHFTASDFIIFEGIVWWLLECTLPLFLPLSPCSLRCKIIICGTQTHRKINSHCLQSKSE